MYKVWCLDDGKKFYFDAKTPYEAMRKMKYTLDLENEDKSCVINKTESGLHLWMEHTGKTYGIRI